MMSVSLILAVVGLAMGTVSILRGSLVVGCLTYLLTAACFGYDFFHFEVGPAVLTVDRLALGMLLATCFVQRHLGRTQAKPLAGSDVLLGLMLLWLTFSTFTHGFDSASPGQVTPLSRLLTGYLIPASLYWIARQAPLNRFSVRILRNTLIGFGLYLAITGILEISQQWSLVFPKQIADRNLGSHFGQTRGPMLTSVSFGLYLAVGFLAGWLAWPRLSLVPQSILLLAFPLATAGVYFSYTHSIWVGAAAGLLITLVMTLRGSLRNFFLGGLSTAGVVVAVIHFAGVANLQDGIAVEAIGNKIPPVSWHMLQQRPVLGYGFGHFREAAWPYWFDQPNIRELSDSRYLDHFNTLLSLTTETGIVGLGLFLATCLAWWRNAWTLNRHSRTPAWARQHGILFMAAFGVYACQLLFHELSFSSLDNSLLFFLAGITVSLRQLAVGAVDGIPEPSSKRYATEMRALRPRAYSPVGV